MINYSGVKNEIIYVYNTKHKIKCSISDIYYYIIWIKIPKPNKDLS